MPNPGRTPDWLLRLENGERPLAKWKAEELCLTCGGKTVRDCTADWHICVECGEEWPRVAYATTTTTGRTT